MYIWMYVLAYIYVYVDVWLFLFLFFHFSILILFTLFSFRFSPNLFYLLFLCQFFSFSVCFSCWIPAPSVVCIDFSYSPVGFLLFAGNLQFAFISFYSSLLDFEFFVYWGSGSPLIFGWV